MTLSLAGQLVLITLTLPPSLVRWGLGQLSSVVALGLGGVLFLVLASGTGYCQYRQRYCCRALQVQVQVVFVQIVQNYAQFA